MQPRQLQLGVGRPAPRGKRVPTTLTLDAQRKAEIEAAAAKWDMSLSKFLERAAMWYIRDLERDPSKLKQPDDEPEEKPNPLKEMR